MADLKLTSVSRKYGGFDALKDLDLTVRDGEFVSLLGPSGCGKSTTLALIAGLDNPTAGQIEIDGKIVADASSRRFVPAEQRNLGLVLQSYALWPHMTVAQNVGLPLEIRNVPKAERKARTQEYLGLVEMGGFEDRYPHELSGGQQQRVALARTLVYEPILLLLDEPLSNVDAKLRERARMWLKALQRRLKVTTIFVTHDQSEALALSDRIAVMSEGRLVQAGTPLEIYRNPKAPFVADFVGSANFMKGRVGASGKIILHGGAPIRASTDLPSGAEVVVALRPEDLSPVRPGESTDNAVSVKIVAKDFLGPRCIYHARLGDQDLRFESTELFLEGEIAVGFSKDVAFVFEAPQ